MRSSIATAWQRADRVFVALLLVALGVRLYLAASWPFIHDEQNTAIPLAQSISFWPGSLNLPLRALNHPALPAYFVKVSFELFGATFLGYRVVHVLGSVLVIGLVYRLTAHVYGATAGRWAAALVAFNEYFLMVSSRATAHVPYLLFTTAALYAFGRFLVTSRAVYLYAAAASVGVAFYSKEHAALLLPVFALTVVLTGRHAWLRRPHVYLASLLFVLVVAPDLAWNVTGSAGDGQATYGTQLDRVGGIAFSPFPSMFYAQEPVMALFAALGRPLEDRTPEYPAMNPGLGILLLGAAVALAVRWPAPGPLRGYLLVAFWGIFGFFSAIRPGETVGLDPVSWLWVDVTMIPAAMLAGIGLAHVTGRWRVVLWGGAGLALAWATVATVRYATFLSQFN